MRETDAPVRELRVKPSGRHVSHATVAKKRVGELEILFHSCASTQSQSSRQSFELQ